nr:PREDICTED: uncharacterized protein LOC107076572 [Lepisosteus oculatus]
MADFAGAPERQDRLVARLSLTTAELREKGAELKGRRLAEQLDLNVTEARELASRVDPYLYQGKAFPWHYVIQMLLLSDTGPERQDNAAGLFPQQTVLTHRARSSPARPHHSTKRGRKKGAVLDESGQRDSAEGLHQGGHWTQPDSSRAIFRVGPREEEEARAVASERGRYFTRTWKERYLNRNHLSEEQSTVGLRKGSEVKDQIHKPTDFSPIRLKASVPDELLDEEQESPLIQQVELSDLQRLMSGLSLDEDIPHSSISLGLNPTADTKCQDKSADETESLSRWVSWKADKEGVSEEEVRCQVVKETKRQHSMYRCLSAHNCTVYRSGREVRLLCTGRRKSECLTHSGEPRVKFKFELQYNMWTMGDICVTDVVFLDDASIRIYRYNLLWFKNFHQTFQLFLGKMLFPFLALYKKAQEEKVHQVTE